MNETQIKLLKEIEHRAHNARVYNNPETVEVQLDHIKNAVDEFRVFSGMEAVEQAPKAAPCAVFVRLDLPNSNGESRNEIVRWLNERLFQFIPPTQVEITGVIFDIDSNTGSGIAKVCRRNAELEKEAERYLDRIEALKKEITTREDQMNRMRSILNEYHP